MPKIGNSDIKAVGVVIVGVFLAGYIMNQFRSNTYVASAIDGFDA
ncbi:hypothetical protein PsW64_03827 [Pseudovibrio sp. W64]|nr:hypothetical protein [Pseudovibrio sp. W64]KZK78188.1 hypothetical protein PsW64_03827 [Pseudovibrio sp. W64]